MQMRTEMELCIMRIMTYNYKVTNMTCGGCIANVKSQLLKHPDVLSAEVNLPDDAIITMEKQITVRQLQDAIGLDSKYQITQNMVLTYI